MAQVSNDYSLYQEPPPGITPTVPEVDPLAWQAEWRAWQQQRAERGMESPVIANPTTPTPTVAPYSERTGSRYEGSYNPNLGQVVVGPGSSTAIPRDVYAPTRFEEYSAQKEKADQFDEAMRRARKDYYSLTGKDLAGTDYTKVRTAVENDIASGGVNTPSDKSPKPTMSPSAPVPYASPGFETKLPYIRPGDAWFSNDFRGGSGWLANPYTPGTYDWQVRQVEVDRRLRQGSGGGGGSSNYSSGGGGGGTPTTTPGTPPTVTPSTWTPRQYQPDAEGYLRVDDNIYAQLPSDARQDFAGLLAGLGYRGTGVYGAGGATELKGSARPIHLTQEQVDQYTTALTKPFVDRLLKQIGWLAPATAASSTSTVRVPPSAAPRVV